MIKNSKKIACTLYFIVLLIFNSFGLIDNREPIDRWSSNVKVFTKIYGTVRFFNPSFESTKIDWDKFCIFAISKIYDCKTSEELIDSLTSVFSSISPSVTFSRVPLEHSKLLKKITPPSNETENYNDVYWQHLGIGTGYNPTYKSIRVMADSVKIYSDRPNFGDFSELYFKEHSLFCYVPLVLKGTKDKSYPVNTELSLNSIKKQYENFSEQEISSCGKYYRMANVVIVWNVFKHFYPYGKTLHIEWDKILTTSLKNAYKAKTEEELLQTLKLMTHDFKDGHIYVNSYSNTDRGFFPPINIDFVEKKIIITEKFESLPFSIGDEILEINNNEAVSCLFNISKYQSAAKESNLLKKSLRKILEGGNNSILKIRVKHNNKIEEVELKRNIPKKKYQNLVDFQNPVFDTIGNGIWYLNMSTISMEKIDSLVPFMLEAKGIICDLRGYPNLNSGFISYLLTSPDTAKWIFLPHIIAPNFQEKMHYDSIGWMLQPKSPHINTNVIFLTNSNAISYSESFLSLVKYYKLATIVGEATGGTNGDINAYILFNKQFIFFTGAKVLALNGAEHHSLGIEPDYNVKKSIKGIRSGEDEYLLRAVKIIQNRTRSPRH